MSDAQQCIAAYSDLIRSYFPHVTPRNRMWFNTAFLQASNWKLELKRDQLDKVCRKPKEYSPNFSVKICVEENKAHEPLLMNSWLHTKSTLFDVTSLLKTVPLLSTIEHVDVIACFLKEDVFEKDDPILVKGDSKHTFCLILSGEAELCGSEDGAETSRKMFKGHSAGDRTLVRKQSCDVDVVARGDVTCIRMVGVDFTFVCDPLHNEGIFFFFFFFFFSSSSVSFPPYDRDPPTPDTTDRRDPRPRYTTPELPSALNFCQPRSTTGSVKRLHARHAAKA